MMIRVESGKKPFLYLRMTEDWSRCYFYFPKQYYKQLPMKMTCRGKAYRLQKEEKVDKQMKNWIGFKGAYVFDNDMDM